MSSDVQSSNPGPVSQLVGGIVSDAQTLMKQQMALFRHEVKEDFRKTLAASSALVGGGVLLVIAAIMLCFMLAHWIHDANPQLPLWGALGMV